MTDGQGRHLAFADSTGWLGSDDYNIRYGDHGGKYAGGTSSASSFNADRFSSPEMPGLSFFRNRAYDQNTGRWTQEDPIGVAGGLNLYQFNGNNPVTNSDPFGLCPIPPWACIPIGVAAANTPGGQRALQTIGTFGAAVIAFAASQSDQVKSGLDRALQKGKDLLIRLPVIGAAIGSIIAGPAVDQSAPAPDGIAAPQIEIPAAPKPQGVDTTSAPQRRDPGYNAQ